MNSYSRLPLILSSIAIATGAAAMALSAKADEPSHGVIYFGEYVERLMSGGQRQQRSTVTIGIGVRKVDNPAQAYDDADAQGKINCEFSHMTSNVRNEPFSCHKIDTFQHACAAIAVDDVVVKTAPNQYGAVYTMGHISKGWGYGIAPTKAAAKSLALNMCESRTENHGSCIFPSDFNPQCAS